MRSSYYELGSIRLQNGSQVNRMLSWLGTRALPLFQKYGFGPRGFFTAGVGPDAPAVFFMVSSPGMGEMEALWGNLDADPNCGGAVTELEKTEPAYYREGARLLGAPAFCPPLAATAPGDPPHKLYELWVYESPTHRQLAYLHERFAGGEIEIFHQSGIHPILYADTILGPNLPNMVYLIPFESEAQREKAWAAFRSNPDWIRIRDESVPRGGEIAQNITNMLLVAASFSMIR
jgi:hypothetical protein